MLVAGKSRDIFLQQVNPDAKIQEIAECLGVEDVKEIDDYWQEVRRREHSLIRPRSKTQELLRYTVVRNEVVQDDVAAESSDVGFTDFNVDEYLRTLEGWRETVHVPKSAYEDLLSALKDVPRAGSSKLLEEFKEMHAVSLLELLDVELAHVHDQAFRGKPVKISIHNGIFVRVVCEPVKYNVAKLSDNSFISHSSLMGKDEFIVRPEVKSTGNAYVDECILWGLEDGDEPRDAFKMDDVRSAVQLGSGYGNEEVGKSLLTKYPDFHIPYLWLSSYYIFNERLKEASALLDQGIQKCRRRRGLYCTYGHLDRHEHNLKEAVVWYIRSAVLQARTGAWDSADPFIYLAYVADFCGLKQVSKKLFGIADEGPKLRIDQSKREELQGLLVSADRHDISSAISEFVKCYAH